MWEFDDQIYSSKLIMIFALASNDDNLKSCVTALIKGDYEQVLLGDVAMAILGSVEEDLGDSSDINDFIRRRIESYITKNQIEEDNARYAGSPS